MSTIIRNLFFFVSAFILISCTDQANHLAEKEPEEVKITPEEDTVPVMKYGFDISEYDIVESKIQRNQNLSEIMNQYNVPYSTVLEMAERSEGVFDIKKMRADAPFEIICTKGDSLHTAKCFVYHPNRVDYVVFKLEDSVLVSMEHMDVDTVRKEMSGVITSSLYKTMIDNGASPALAGELAEVYAWQVDFFAIQKNDKFKLIYEDRLVNGESIGVGRILAATFTHYGKDYQAYFYDQGDTGIEYFDEEGNSLQKAFLKAPLKYSRISSRFSNSRLHPVLKIRRPHHGVDYAAPTGTPVHAVGDGRILKARYSGGAGNYVKIQHNSMYSTAYMHLSKYGPGIKAGVSVKQGDVIGYVGSTGLSTGPHLDFRFYKGGQAVDPLTVDPPSAEPIAEEKRADYMKVMKQYQQELKKVDYIQPQPAAAEEAANDN